jgi:hypothetical protein
MKKLLITAIMCLIALQSFAQTQIGIKAGYSLSNQTLKDIPQLVAPVLSSDTDPLSSFYIGAYSSFTLSDLFSISPELYYARRGDKLHYSIFDVIVTSKYHDLVIPILGVFRITRKTSLFAGPEFNIVLRNNWTATSGISPASKGSGAGAGKNQRSFDIGLSGGGSYNIGRNLVFEIRYTHGLLDQSKTYNIPGELLGTEYAGQQIPVDYVAKNWSMEAGLKYNFTKIGKGKN